MNQLSLHCTASREIKSTWLTWMLFIFCLLLLVWLSLKSCSIQSLFRMECWFLAFPTCFSQQSTTVRPRLGLRSKETGSFGCELQCPFWSFHRGQQTFVNRAELSSEMGCLGREKQCYSSCLIPCCVERDIIHLLYLCSIKNALYSHVGKNQFLGQPFEQ